MDGNVEIFIGLLRRFIAQADDYAESLSEYLKADDYVNYIIVVNGAKSLLYNIGAKSCGDMAARLESTADGKDKESFRKKNEQFCEHLKWLSQRVALALPQQNSAEASENKESGGGLVKLAGIMHDLSFDYSIGDCLSIDKHIAVLKESSFGEEYDEIISEIVIETETMEYERAARLCKRILNTLLNE
jgi:HPt (histidine-containing phosphotransfer) domain-containing protein